MFNIILEGCDSTGKSSIYEEIMHRGILGKRMIGFKFHNKMPPKSFIDGQKLNEEILKISNSNNGLVFDRHILSERVYAPLLRNYYPIYIDKLENQLKDYNILFLITASVEKVKQRFDGKGITTELIPKVLSTYIFHFTHCHYPHKFIIDTSEITPFQALEQIEKILQKL